MVEITFELTRRCNYDCAHCLRDFDHQVSDLPLDLMDCVIGQALRYGVSKVGWTGGEPTLHPNFGEALDIVASHGLKVHFVTNGTTFVRRVVPLLRSPARREAFDFVVFSLDGSTAAIQDRIRAPKAYEKVMRSIAACKALGLRFGLSFIVGQLNRDDLDRVALLASHLGAEFLSIDHTHPTPENVRRGVPLPLDEWRSVEQDLHRLTKALSLRLTPCQTMYNTNPLYMCPTKAGQVLHVDFEGNLIFCCTLSAFRDGTGERQDIIADLRTTSLFDAHRLWMDRAHELQRERLALVEQGRLRPADYYPCLSCHRQFGHMGWTEAY